MADLIPIALAAVAVHGLMGLLFAVGFHWRGMGAIDSGTRDSGLGFRLLVSPGIVALWPLLAWRWLRVARGGVSTAPPDAPVTPGRLRSMHAWLWKGLAVGIPLLVGLALYWRPSEAPGPRWSTVAPPAATTSDRLHP